MELVDAMEYISLRRLMKDIKNTKKQMITYLTWNALVFLSYFGYSIWLITQENSLFIGFFFFSQVHMLMELALVYIFNRYCETEREVIDRLQELRNG
jgi:hypothetical protein